MASLFVLFLVVRFVLYVVCFMGCTDCLSHLLRGGMAAILLHHRRRRSTRETSFSSPSCFVIVSHGGFCLPPCLRPGGGVLLLFAFVLLRTYLFVLFRQCFHFSPIFVYSISFRYSSFVFRFCLVQRIWVDGV